MAKKSAKSKGFRRQNTKKPYLSKREIAAVCVIAVLLAVGAFFLFRYDDGALKVQDGAVVADGDNWLIANGSNVRGRARYYKLGEIGEIEGYNREKGALTGDANIPEYVFKPSEEGGDVAVTVTCGHGSAEAMAEYARSTLEGIEITTAGEIQSAEMAGQPVQYYSYATDYTAKEAEAGDAAEGVAPEAEAGDTSEGVAPEAEAGDAAEGKAPEETALYSRSVAGYIDAAHECCVIINVVSRGDSADDCQPEEALTALLEKAAGAVTLDKGEKR